MATKPKIPSSIEGIEAEMQRVQEQLATLSAAKRRALEEQRDAGRPVLMAALAKVKIGDLSKADAKAIASRIETLGPARAAEVLAAA